MSTDPNQSSQLPKSASSAPARAQSQSKGQTNAAPEPSSPAESMTDQPPTTLATPPTRIPASESAGSANPPAAKAATPKSSTAVPDSIASPDSTDSEAPTESSAELAADLTPDLAEPPAVPTDSPITSPDSLVAPSSDQPSETASPAAEAAESAPSLETASDTTEASEANSEAATSLGQSLLRNQPIPPASEPMQYRAIGLVRGRYTPSEEQFTRGAIITDDGVTIDAVLLGRVMSLVKKHIDLAESHLWVVYPRTREKDLELHMQIVGVWEPDKLNRMGGEASATVSEDLETEPDEEAIEVEAAEPAAEVAEPAVEEAAEEAEPVATAEPVAVADAEARLEEDLDDRYFSVRGEVVFQAEEEERVLVKIRRAPKPGETEGKAFKVALKGSLTGKALGYFWDMQVRREGSDLIVQEATQIGMVPPQKRKPGGRRGPGGRPPRRGASGPPRRPAQAGQAGPPRRRWDNREGGREPGREGGRENRPYRSERPSTPAPAVPKPPVAKPVKRQKEEPSS